jgi:hypothetical protein
MHGPNSVTHGDTDGFAIRSNWIPDFGASDSGAGMPFWMDAFGSEMFQSICNG